MKGLELAERYYREEGVRAFEKACPEAMDFIAAGLAGEGSECFGFDDALSRDHDWGPGFCLWLSKEHFERYGAALGEAYNSLPRPWLGYERLRENEMSAGRVGVLETGGFYRRFLGRDTLPETPAQWLTLPEPGLATCTNGKVFEDRCGDFSAFRKTLLDFYPEDVRLKKLAARCALAAQSGQYNLPRCLERGESVAALSALGEFLTHAQAVIFLLNRRYRPYYKWTHRALRELPILGAVSAARLEALAGAAHPARQTAAVEELSALIITELRRQGLSGSPGDFLLDHGVSVQERITDETLRRLPLMAG